MPKELTRTIYLKQIKAFIDKPVIKVITGMRRSGKSYFLRQIIQSLSSDSQVVYIDMENIEFDLIKTYKDLEQYVSEQIDKRKKTYLFIDEVQKIEAWEKLIASYNSSNKFDIYITGSNSDLLSSELATLIAGRYVELRLYTLSFSEFIEFRKVFAAKKSIDLREEFENYLEFGGLPGIHQLDLKEADTYKFISAIFNTIILKDVISRYEVRNVRVLENTYSYILDNLGNISSAKKISDYFKSQKIKVSVDTILSYISYLEACMLCTKVQRYDIKGKKLLEIQEKYFTNDIGLRNALLGYKRSDISGLLENIVFQHLQIAGYKVQIGKLNDLEIDFIATRNKEKKYFQVCYLLSDKQVEQREFKPLLAIKDAYPKYVLSLDEHWGSDYEGIQRLNLIDFLLTITD